MRKLWFFIPVLFAITALVFWGCKKDDPDNNDPVPTDEIELIVNTDGVSETQKRVHYINEPLFDTSYQKKKKDSRAVGAEALFMHVAEVESPVVGDRVLSATHVKFNGKFAYVSYHYNEPNSSPMSEALYEGHIDVFDVENPLFPIILSTAQNHRADFNTMFLDYETTGAQRRLWIGATDYGVGGAVFDLDLTDNVILPGTMMTRYKTPPGNSVNGVVRSADWLYATAGRTEGGVFVFDEEKMQLETSLTNEFENAKYAAVSGYSVGDKHVVLRSGTNAQLLVYEVGAAHTEIATYDIGSIEPETGKSGIYVKNNICWVAMGYAGLKAFDLNDGSLVHTLSPENMGDAAVTNGVCLDDDYVYVANGSDGLYLCAMVEGQQELEVLETHNFGASANYIDVGEDLIFIANGREGLQILRRIPPGDYTVICDYDDDGIPECIEPNPYDLCETLVSDLDAALPESKSVFTYHPEYLDNPNTTLELLEPATVYVTFIDEGAGWKNSLGTYHYPADSPPETVDDIRDSKLLIYPNSSKQGAGGALTAGTTIKLLGTFPQGTNVGAFLVARGWAGKSSTYPSGLSEGAYTHYSNDILNIAQAQQTLLFYDVSCDAIVLAIEDVKVGTGDDDFNDCMFQIIVDPPTAVNTDLYIQIGE